VNGRAEVWLDTVLRRSPVQPVFHWRAAQRLAVLGYHGIDDGERFGQHLDHIRRMAVVVSLEEALDGIHGRGTLPRRAVLLTFDDGHRSVLEVGLPMLRERGLPAVVFVVAGIVDSDRPFWWTEVIDLATRGGSVTGMHALEPPDLVRAFKSVADERRLEAIEELRRTAKGSTAPTPQLTTEDLRTMESAGIAIGNHTWSHASLSRCAEAVCVREIESSHEMLSKALGHPPSSFAYPFGDRDTRAASLLRELGYQGAFLFDHRLSPRRPSNPFAISRLRVNSDTTLDRFRTIVSGLHPTVHRVRGGS
jgi:peptidoglycan/xylan/chitin deacetylase (PgdA/CDA1 family)